MREADRLLKSGSIFRAFFSNVGDELADVARGRLSAEEAFQQVLDKGWNKAL